MPAGSRGEGAAGSHGAGRARHGSLRMELLTWVMLTLVGVLGLNLVISYYQARSTARLVTETLLTGSARMIAEAVRVDETGNASFSLPPAALEIFDTGNGDRVYFQVLTAWGSLLAGTSALHLPARPLVGETMELRGTPVRVLMLQHPVVGLDHDGTGRAYSDGEGLITVGIAVTLNRETTMWHEMWLSDFYSQTGLVLVAGLVTAFGLRRGLAPVLRLRDRVIATGREALDPFDPALVQSELQPLVEALNGYMSRVRLQMEAQRRFVANAAHQLRTPLTLLSTQASVAARETDPGQRHDALLALIRSTRQVSRLASQLLTLTRAEPGSRAPRSERVSMVQVAERVLEAHAGEALERDIDLGLEAEASSEASVVIGDGTMLREMVVNLVDNALRYTPAPGEVTVTVTREDERVVLLVEDSGPGIPESEREQVFERFYRVIGTQAEGSGLGLAIVREVVTGAGGTVALGTSRHGGLGVRVDLPAG